MGPHDDRDMGPGYWEPEGYDDAQREAFDEGAKSRDAEVTQITDDLCQAEADLKEAKEEIERLRALLVSLGALEAA